MAGTYLTTSDIVNWINDWHSKHSTYTEAEVAVFAEELNGKIGQMDFRASNGGTAIGYAGVIDENGWKSGVFNTVSEIRTAYSGNGILYPAKWYVVESGLTGKASGCTEYTDTVLGA